MSPRTRNAVRFKAQSSAPALGWAAAWRAVSLIALALLCAVPAIAGTTGKVRGKVIGTDSGEPIGFADIMLIPADTTMRKVGAMTNADGTYLLEAAPGVYTLQVRALSYAVKRVPSVEIKADELLPINVALQSEAIQQKEVVVEAQARTNTEVSLIQTRKKAAALSDAVSAEQVRKTPDRDAAEVLRRVTGLSIADGKYVFVRGLGERYSSTEVDGVRIASPEQNKRVVPLDLVPATLLDNIVVQKTYTADRPGEFGGGDVEVRTKDFPGQRTFSVSAGQGFEEGVTFQNRLTYGSYASDLFGFGAGARGIPAAVYQTAGNKPLVDSSDPSLGFDRSVLAGIGRSFENVWTPTQERAIPNGSYAASFGDEFHLLGRPLGLVLSSSLSRNFDHRNEFARNFADARDTNYNYAVERSTERVQLGAVAALSYRLSPKHTLSVRGLLTNDAEDEVRTYQGTDYASSGSLPGTHLEQRATRLRYVERTIGTGAVQGTHDLTRLWSSQLHWKVGVSEARRQEPDRRETSYDKRVTRGPNGTFIVNWVNTGTARREYGDLKDKGRDASLSWSLPTSLGALGKGRFTLGYDTQRKNRDNFYRRFNLYARGTGSRAKPPEQIFADSNFTGGPGTAYVEEATLSEDNYRAKQAVDAQFVTADIPFGRKLRSTIGVRREQAMMEIISFDLFFPDQITQYGRLDNTDLLPSANLTWSVNDMTNLRVAASRTLSRPDLTELSSSPSLEYRAGYEVRGNPNLRRAQLRNYDIRAEIFPGLSELFAAGFFYKDLIDPIEQVITAGSPHILVPNNSAGGHNYGVELEARMGLNRIWGRLKGFSVNANSTLINSSIKLKNGVVSDAFTNEHPLQGQASYMVNASLGYTSRRRVIDIAVIGAFTGRRLTAIAEGPLGDVYEQPSGTVDVTAIFTPARSVSLKLGAKNLLDPTIRETQGGLERNAYHNGRVYAFQWTYAP